MCPHPCSNSLRVQSFPLFFWRSVLPSLPSCVRSPAITSMFCPITFHQSIPSECFLRRHQLEVIFTTVGNSHFLLHYFSVIIFLLIRILPCPSFSPWQMLPTSTPSRDLCWSLYCSLCHFYRPQWLHSLLPPEDALSFNFDTYLHYLPEKNYRGLERTAESSSHSFSEVGTIGWCKFYRGEKHYNLNEHSCKHSVLMRRKLVLG